MSPNLALQRRASAGHALKTQGFQAHGGTQGAWTGRARVFHSRGLICRRAET
ncbi:hypothetical protein CSIRO_0619 [Bradyrhizobiaceae bacterium SG-6C]|nr:hypothetical protein CSIRO_0619 [Bradyrhizobiaceae bacterium SG-6C]